MSQNLVAKTANLLSAIGASMKSMVKIATTRKPSLKPAIGSQNGRQLIVLGNGPSLRQNLDNDIDLLSVSHTMAVNFAANSAEFTLIRPKYYVLADPHFFSNTADPNVARLLSSLNSITWEMTLFVPSSAKIARHTFTGPHLKVITFPFIAVEGTHRFTDFAFDHALGMPRPRNVLIPSIMIGAWLGYRQIYLLGADHSWLSTLSVTDSNRVVTVQPHFYKEDEREQNRITSVYKGVRLHQILDSFRIAFKSYHEIARWANLRNIEIYNSTPGSMIDAFTRKPLPKT